MIRTQYIEHDFIYNNGIIFMQRSAENSRIVENLQSAQCKNIHTRM